VAIPVENSAAEYSRLNAARPNCRSWNAQLCRRNLAPMTTALSICPTTRKCYQRGREPGLREAAITDA